MPTLLQKGIAELFGTFVLTFCACGCAGGTFGTTSSTSLSFGLSIVAMAYSIGHISGCHINPAVSIAFLITGQLSFLEFIIYIFSQFIGGLIGAMSVFGFVYMSLPSPKTENMITIFGDATNNILFFDTEGYELGRIIGAVLTEVVLTFIFVFVILKITEQSNQNSNLAGLLIGGTLTLVHLVGIQITGTSVNPARSLATAVSQIFYFDSKNSIKQIWIWVVGPMIGGALAPFFYLFLNKDFGNNNEPQSVPRPVNIAVSVDNNDTVSMQKIIKDANCSK